MSEEIFTRIYNTNKWKSEESVSGNGSTLKSNEVLLPLLEQFAIDNDIHSYLDLACGDFNWMKEFDFNILSSYKGVDIVKDLITLNNTNYSNSKIKFEYSNIIKDSIQRTDFIMCKDCLFHFSYDDALSTLKHIIKSKSTFLASTTFHKHSNFNIKTGTWRQINLQEAPFNFPKPFIIWENVEQRKDSNSDKSIAVWKIEDLVL